MAPSNGDKAEGKPSGRGGRPVVGRVVPAIPFALSKPRVARQAKVENKAKAGEALADSGNVAVENKVNGIREALGGQVAKVVEPVEEKQEQQVKEDTSSQPESTHEEQPVVPKIEQDAIKNAPSVYSDSAAMSVSDAPTPDISSSEATRPTSSPTNGLAESVDSIVTDHTSASRKPMDRFDMRAIRTELPPAFVPSAEQYTPQSATSSQTRPQPTFVPAHNPRPSHPSTSSIVFGGRDSSNSSPAPPMSSNSAFQPPQPPPQATFYGHAHHASEPPQGQRTYPQSYAQPQNTPYGVRGAPQQFYHSQHAPFRYPQRESFATSVNSPTNGFAGNSRSESPFSPHATDRSMSDLQSPLPVEYATNSARPTQYNAKAVASTKNQHRAMPTQHHYPPMPPSFNHEMSSYESAEALRDYLMARFNNAELADCTLDIIEGDGQTVRILDAHKIVLGRSTTLINIITSGDQSASIAEKVRSKIVLDGQYVRLKPFLHAVRYLYGGPLPVLEFYTQGPNGTAVIPTSERIESALQYIATGAWLQVSAIAHRGVDIAFSLISWETVPAVLAFALEGGLGPMWPAEHSSSSRSSPKYDPYASALLQRLLDFMVHNFPPNFYIDSSAPQLTACPRIPSYPTTSSPRTQQPTVSHNSRPSTSTSASADPRLTKIRFGDLSADLPAETHARPSPAATNISSILLSLPFPLLKYLLEHPALSDRLGAETVSSIMRQVVGEREARRVKAVNASGLAVNGTSNGNLEWEEEVRRSEVHRAGFCLERKMVGGTTTNGVVDGPQT